MQPESEQKSDFQTWKFYGPGSGLKNIATGAEWEFEKNAFLTMHLFFMLFSLQFHEAPTMLVWNSFKQCINVRFMSIVNSPMLSISKLTYFKKHAGIFHRKKILSSIEMARAANSPVFGQSARGFETVCWQFF